MARAATSQAQRKIGAPRCARSRLVRIYSLRDCNTVATLTLSNSVELTHSPMRSHKFSTAGRLLVAILTALLTTPSMGRAGITDAVKSQTLPNGLKVLVLENHKAPVATLNIFYRVGSRNEQIGKTGISHLCEHLMFR